MKLNMLNIALCFPLFACGEEASKVEEACSDIDVEECENSSDCTALKGNEMISNSECFILGPEEHLGCISVDEVCDDYTTPALAPEGGTFLVASSCIPEGYEIVIFEYYPECEEE